MGTTAIAVRRVGSWPWEVTDFSYVYMLQSQRVTTAHYVGRTNDLDARLAWHNHGSVPATRRLRPWRIKTAVMFTDEARAFAFERYLKSGSGRTFAEKHF